MSNLYVVGTPIGNLSDITKRAIQTLKKSQLIAAEDTRVTGKLLYEFSITTRMISFNKDNASKRIPIILEELKSGDVSLVSDAGTPGISDPGFELISAISNTDIHIVPIPGASAITSAVSVSPFKSDEFYFAGFAPRKKKDINSLLNKIDLLEVPTVLFESPNRIKPLFKWLSERDSERKIVVMREMTKLYEERFEGTVSDALKHFDEPRGEFTIVLSPKPIDVTQLTEDEIAQFIENYHAKSMKTKDISRQLSLITGMSGHESYRLVLNTLKERGISK